MIRLEFDNNGTMELLGIFNTQEEANKALIQRYTNDDFKSYYWRECLAKDGHSVIDFGSHTCFGHFYQV